MLLASHHVALLLCCFDSSKDTLHDSKELLELMLVMPRRAVLSALNVMLRASCAWQHDAFGPGACGVRSTRHWYCAMKDFTTVSSGVCECVLVLTW